MPIAINAHLYNRQKLRMMDWNMQDNGNVMAETATPQPKVIDYRYQIEALIGKGGMGAVYRAKDRLTGELVALKQVTIPDDQLQFASLSDTSDVRVALAREFKTLASLRHPNIISVLDYGFDADRQPYFTMELLEDAQNVVTFLRGQPRRKQVELAIQIIQALVYLHQRGIIHRDLKPDNILVAKNQKGEPQVKVLDFGLAISRDFASNLDDVVTGTIAYMSPEVLQGKPATEASDLYALGVVGYEIFRGEHPFQINNMNQLMQDILIQQPNVWSLNASLEMKEILQKLMQKDPEKRYLSARRLLRDYCKVNNVNLSETETIRESYLQAAKFVGRDKEFTQLKSALKDALKGKGSTWLIGGERGVGKSRLLDELRTQALVDGAQVVHGNLEEGGSQSYFLWRDIIRFLLLASDVTDQEASALKPIIPDIETLIGRKTSKVVHGTSEQEQDRLIQTIVNLIRKQKQPLVLLLEDLQWAQESLEPLKRLNRIVENLPILIVADYHHDARHDLAELLPSMQHMTLERLSEQDISALTTAILGNQVTRKAEIIDLLQRETAGNAVFMIEVLRELADDAGSLNQIGNITLPQDIIAGGIHEIMRKRCERIPLDERPHLWLSAVIGREIRLDLLEYLDDEWDYDRWLRLCGDLAILEVQENTWRFTHNRIREVLLENLADDVKQQLNEMVAEAIESQQPDDPSYYNVLLDHYQRAGNHEKVAHYARLEGEQLLSVNRYNDALTSLQRALELDSSVENQRHIYPQLGNLYLRINNLEKAETTFAQALKLALDVKDKRKIADVLVGQGDLALRQGDGRACRQYYRKALALYREMDNQKGVVDRLLGLGTVYFKEGNFVRAKRYFQEALATSRSIEYKIGKAESQYNLGLIALRTGKDLASVHKMAQDSLALSLEVGIPSQMMRNLAHIGRIYYSLQDYPQSLTYLRESMGIAESLDDKRMIAEIHADIGLNYVRQGKLKVAQEHFEKGLQLARDINSPQLESYHLNDLGEVYSHQQQHEKALDHYEQSIAIKRTINEQYSLSFSLIHSAFAYLKFNRYDDARKNLIEGLEIAMRIDAVTKITLALVGFAHLAYTSTDYDICGELLGFVTNQSALGRNINRVDEVMGKLASTLSATQLQEAFERGTAHTLESAIQRAKQIQPISSPAS